MLEVDRERPGAYDSIEAAIDVAENGDEIVVAPGLYEVRAAIRFNATGARPVRNLVLRSSHGPDRTEIRLVESTSSIFVFDAGEDSRSVVQGFRIRGGKGTGGESDPFYSQGGAIYCSGGSSPRFVDCKITGQDIEGAGGAIACNNASPVFIGCDISQNTARIGGAMLAGGPHSKPILKGCSIVGNRAREVPGILVGDEAIVTLEDCVVRGNHAELGLGAIRSDRGILHLERVRFDGNTARSAGAISCDARSELTARNCVFVRNSVTSDAGAIYVGAGSKAALSFCTIAYNTGPVHGGGAIFVTQSELVIENSILWGNGFGPIYPPGESGITIERSIVEGGWPGTG
ncbi:MAG TPA: right-handed parallel beta-helix repeat-containing protein, partial [Planctomycetota bacterium]|nr:right-handed parallel beta-helix repeat-containing protein [Planctomycetota bacterium]